MSIHCTLSGVKATEWTQEAVLYFSERTSDFQICGEFLEKTEGKWEILLCDDEGKNENLYNLKGFDTGSTCMVWSGVHWYKAEILGVSNAGTKVLNLSSGNEEVVNPVDVWNRIPALDTSLIEETKDGCRAKMEDAAAPILDTKMGTLHSATKLSVGKEVEEMMDTLDGNTRSFVM